MMILKIVAAFAVVVALALPVNAGERADEMRERTNRSRQNHSLTILRGDANLARLALQHSRRMAAEGTLRHTNCLRCGVREGWRTLGENVGVGESLRSLQASFMDSPDHRSNILCRCFTRVGVGVVKSDGKLWVTVRFRG